METTFEALPVGTMFAIADDRWPSAIGLKKTRPTTYLDYNGVPNRHTYLKMRVVIAQ